MQYSIQLPHNFEAAKIRSRVDTRRTLFDAHPGLVHKSFLYNDEEKLYAPFYIWKDVTEAKDFLLDDLFHGVTETFSRHRVRSWLVLQVIHGNRLLKPAFAMREVDVIPPETKLDTFLCHEKDAQSELQGDKNLYMHLIALDADRWEIMRFSLWKDRAGAAKPGSDSHVDYDVLHVSEPE